MRVSAQKKKEIENIIAMLDQGNTVSFEDNGIDMPGGGRTTIWKQSKNVYSEYSAGHGWCDQAATEISKNTLYHILSKIYLANLREARVWQPEEE